MGVSLAIMIDMNEVEDKEKNKDEWGDIWCEAPKFKIHLEENILEGPKDGKLGEKEVDRTCDWIEKNFWNCSVSVTILGSDNDAFDCGTTIVALGYWKI